MSTPIRRSRVIPALVLASALAGGLEAGAIEDQVTLYTPSFEGPPALAGSVATVLNLQIWQTLRRAPGGDSKLSFGSGVVVWGRPLERYSHETAEQQAKGGSLLAQFVFWGKVYPFGEQAVAQAHLSIPKYKDFRESHPEIWTVRVRRGSGDVEFSADLPERRYSFEPIVLASEVVERYSHPGALVLHPSPESPESIGTVGDEFTALEHRGDKAKVRSGKQVGWVRLPQLSQRRSEVVDFVGGLIRVFRGDWAGAESLMEKVVGNETAPNDLRTDAWLYKGFAEARQGRSPERSLQEARRLSPSARRCAVYAVMGALSEIQRLQAAGTDLLQLKSRLELARQLLEETRLLFEPGDPWLASTTNGLARLAQ